MFFPAPGTGLAGAKRGAVGGLLPHQALRLAGQQASGARL